MLGGWLVYPGPVDLHLGLDRPREGSWLRRTARPAGLAGRQRLPEAVLRDLCMGMGVAPGYGYGYGCLCHGYGLPLSPMHLCHGYGYGCLQAGELVGERVPAVAQLRSRRPSPRGPSGPKHLL